MICGVLNMVDDYKPSKELVIKILISNAVIYTILMIIPYITSTGFNSYTEYWLYKGESGWFFSANEVGAVLTLLLICIYYFISKYIKIRITKSYSFNYFTKIIFSFYKSVR